MYEDIYVHLESNFELSAMLPSTMLRFKVAADKRSETNSPSFTFVSVSDQFSSCKISLGLTDV